jgi:hypothetical protein
VLAKVTLVNSTTVQVQGLDATNSGTSVLKGTTFYVYHR